MLRFAATALVYLRNLGFCLFAVVLLFPAAGVTKCLLVSGGPLIYEGVIRLLGEAAGLASLNNTQICSPN